jgi:hypothetical protein
MESCNRSYKIRHAETGSYASVGIAVSIFVEKKNIIDCVHIRCTRDLLAIILDQWRDYPWKLYYN